MKKGVVYRRGMEETEGRKEKERSGRRDGGGCHVYRKGWERQKEVGASGRDG